jgi:hypothetical protein
VLAVAVLAWITSGSVFRFVDVLVLALVGWGCALAILPRTRALAQIARKPPEL